MFFFFIQNYAWGCSLANVNKYCLFQNVHHPWSTISRPYFNKTMCSWTCCAVSATAHKLELLFLSGSCFYRMAGIFNVRASTKVNAHLSAAMASTSETMCAWKKAVLLDPDGSTSDLLDASSSNGSDDVATSEFSLDEKISPNQPETSAVSRQ